VELVDAADTVIASSEDSTAAGQVVRWTKSRSPLTEPSACASRRLSVISRSSGNYVVSVWDVTADVSSLLLNKQVVGQIENPYSMDKWQFSATAGTQVRFDLVNRSSSGILFDMSGPAGWTGFKDLDRDSDLITLPSAGTYTLTARGIGGQAVGVPTAFKMQQTRVTDLALGSFQTGQFVGSGQAELFRIDVPDQQPAEGRP
jgi:hypothetical protein